MIKRLVTIILTAIIGMSSVMPAYAYADGFSEKLYELTDGVLKPYTKGSGYLIIENADRDYVDDNVDAVFNQIPSVTLYYADHVWIAKNDGMWARILYYEDAEKVVDAIEKSNAWLSADMPSIVPAGTDMETALRLCADYIADHVTYDWEGEKDKVVKKHYQAAWPGMYEGKGICTTYATMFNSMVDYLPFNEFGVVDYTSGTTHLDTTLETAFYHSWSGIQVGDKYRQYDITNYSINKKSEKYFNMTPEFVSSKAAYSKEGIVLF